MNAAGYCVPAGRVSPSGGAQPPHGGGQSAAACRRPPSPPQSGGKSSRDFLDIELIDYGDFELNFEKKFKDLTKVISILN